MAWNPDFDPDSNTPGTQTPNFRPWLGEPAGPAGEFRPNKDETLYGAGVKNRGSQITPWQGAVNIWVDCKAFIQSYDGNTYDVSEDIVTGSLTRNQNAPTTLSLTINNDGDKYRQMFIPMDRLVVFLRRDENEYQSFTGYISHLPVFNIVTSQQITIQAECIIRRFKQKHWDPNLMENSAILSSPADPGSIITPDMTLAFLLTAPDQIGLKPESVFIQMFPPEWTEAVTELNAQNASCMTLWEDLIVCPDEGVLGCGEEGSDGTSDPASGDTTGCPGTLGEVIDQAGFPSSERERAIQTAFCESGGNAGIENNTSAGQAAGGPIGLFQIVPGTAEGVGRDPAQLKDPLYNATTARMIWEEQGWTPWACEPGVGQYGKGSADTKITNCPGSSNVIAGGQYSQVISAAPTDSGGSAPTKNPPSGWDNVDHAAMEMRVQVNSSLGGLIDTAINQWNLGGVNIIKTSSNPTMVITDGPLNGGIAGVTGSGGTMKLDSAQINASPAKQSIVTHEFGHALGFPHASGSSVMTAAVGANSPDAPTQSDIDLYCRTWGCDPNAADGAPTGDEGAGCGPGTTGNPPTSEEEPTEGTAPETANVRVGSMFGVEGGWILWPYTKGDSAFGSGSGIHAGVDVATGKDMSGARIYAIGSGTVAQGPRPGNGCGDHVLIIKYDRGPMTLYCHNASANIREGMRVRNGTLLGTVGCEGTCATKSPDYPHIHIQTAITDDPNEVFDWSKTVDPAIALGINTSGGSPQMYEKQEEMFPSLSPNGPIKDISAGPDKLEAPSMVAEMGRGAKPQGPQAALRLMIMEGRSLANANTYYKWGGGHNNNMNVERARNGGLDSTGLFNVLRKAAHLSPSDVGGPPQWWDFLTDKSPFQPTKLYPVGTILIGKGGGNRQGHMAMVIDEDQHIMEMNGQLNRVTLHGMVRLANKERHHFTHVGTMPDVGILESEAVKRRKKLDPYAKRPRQNQSEAVISAAPCDDSNWDYNASGATTHNHSSLISSIISSVKGQWDVFSNTYPGHPGGETNSVDFWAPGGRGADLDTPTGDAIVDHLISNYADKINWLIWNGRMLDPSGWGPDTSGWGHYDHVHVTAGSNDCGGGTIAGVAGADPGGGSGEPGSGDGTGGGGSAVSEEPCIMRNPLGPFRLGLQISSTAANSEVLRSLITSNGQEYFGTEKSAYDAQFDKFGWDWTIDSFAVPTEVRDWTQLGELYKVPYLDTVKQLTDAGLYTMQSIGTGEVVFWYPFLVNYLRPYVLKPTTTNPSGQEFNEDRGAPDESTDRPDDWFNQQPNEGEEFDNQRGFPDEGTRGPSSNVIAAGPTQFAAAKEDKGTSDEVEAAAKLMQRDSSGNIINSLANQQKYENFREQSPELEDISWEEFLQLEKELSSTDNLGDIPFVDYSLDPEKARNTEVLTRPLVLRDVELLDFHISVSDDPLVTHYYVLGDYRMEGEPTPSLVELPCWRWSTIFSNPLFQWKAENGTDFDPQAFLYRYGSRPLVEVKGQIKFPALAQIWADSMFLHHWLSCYTIELDVAFIPEIYPGQMIQIESLGVECMVLQSSHSFGSTWSTTVTCSMPIQVTDKSKIPPIPFWALMSQEDLEESDLGELPDPTAPPEDITGEATETEEPFGEGGTMPLPSTGELTADIDAKRSADAAYVTQFLQKWALENKATQNQTEYQQRQAQIREDRSSRIGKPGDSMFGFFPHRPPEPVYTAPTEEEIQDMSRIPNEDDMTLEDLVNREDK